MEPIREAPAILPMGKIRYTWRHQNDETADEIEGQNTIITNTEPSLTRQEFKDEVDINVMMARFGVTDGAIPPMALDPQYFGNFEDALDLRTALDRTKEAVERFEALPAEIRNRFNNDPTALFEFVINPENHPEAVKLGLLYEDRSTIKEPPAPPAAS